MIKLLEKHQNKKCLECPYHWSDGMYSEHGCYIEEGRLGKFWQRLTEMLHRDEYSGCFIPLFIIKIVLSLAIQEIYKKKNNLGCKRK